MLVKNALCSLLLFCHHWTRRKTPARIFISLPVRATRVDHAHLLTFNVAGNWLKTHPIPSDKGSLGNFELLAQDNKRVIQQILEAEVEWSGSYDDHILKKLRGMYSSCMNEHTLNNRGIKPLIEVVSTVQKLFRGDARTRSETDTSDYETQDRQSLTAALAYLHSRSIGALFSFDIDGDVGKDPNFMTLWFGYVYLSSSKYQTSSENDQ